MKNKRTENRIQGNRNVNPPMITNKAINIVGINTANSTVIGATSFPLLVFPVISSSINSSTIGSSNPIPKMIT
jgi:hypothetical protein